MPQPVFHLKWKAGIKGADVDLKAALKIIGMYILRPTVSCLLLQSAPHKFQPCLVEVVAELICSGHPNQDWRGIGDQAQPLFTMAEGVFHLLALYQFRRKPCQYIQRPQLTFERAPRCPVMN